MSGNVARSGWLTEVLAEAVSSHAAATKPQKTRRTVKTHRFRLTSGEVVLPDLRPIRTYTGAKGATRRAGHPRLERRPAPSLGNASTFTLVDNRNPGT